MITPVAPDELAEILISTWHLSGYVQQFPMTTALDRALKSAMARGAFDPWSQRLTFSKACAELHLGQACTRMRVLEMAPALSYATRSGLLEPPDERRESHIKITEAAAEALLQKWQIPLACGPLWGGALREEVEREMALGDKHFGYDEPKETSEGSEEDEKESV